jgi:AraC family transcriptional regulator
MGKHWVGKAKGNVNARVLVCDLGPSAFVNLEDERGGHVDLRPHVGASPVAPGILERVEALCLSGEEVPRAYADALTTVLAYELLRAYATKPVSPPRGTLLRASRFKPVLDRIEESLANDAGLSELASLVGLSVSRFSHAFNAAYGVAPHRYILQRRIERAKVLLRRSDATVASVSARVGFSSQSRFTQTFARHTGLTPSAYRQELVR